MLIPSAEQLYKKLDEAVRGLVGFNAAGIAGVVALAGKVSPMPTSLRIAGIIFLIGVFAGVAAWIFGIPGPPADLMEKWVRDSDREMKYIMIALYLSAAAFLVGVSIAFFPSKQFPNPFEDRRLATRRLKRGRRKLETKARLDKS
jgi:hypothetical protein